MDKKHRRSIIFISICMFVLLFSTIIFTFYTFYKDSEAYIGMLGESNLSYETVKIENYLQKGINTIQITADNVDYMISQGATQEEIHEFLEIESEHQKKEIDENFTGIYGYINGEYLDGVNWVPPVGYDPTKRDWYTAAMDGKGEVVIVSPYLDAQTKSIMISLSKVLSDGTSVVSLDIALNEIQRITENIQMDKVGYGFIIEQDGLVIAHLNESEKGKIYTDENYDGIISQIIKEKDGSFNAVLDNEKCVIFTKEISESWHVVMVVSKTKMLEGLRNRVVINSVVCIISFLIILSFCVYAYRKIRLHEMQDQESQRKLDLLYTNVIKALAYTIDAKDRYTSGHSQRVATYSLELAKRMGKSEEEQKNIYYAGLLHDVGKIRVPEDVINKPGKLTDEEFNQIKIHPVSSFHILKDIYEDPSISLGAKYHHERYDGKGYPNGLVGDNIPEIARIIGVADSYDAMASNRSYRKALPQNVVREEIEKGKGKQFDPVIADYMLQMMEEDVDYKMCQTGEMFRRLLVVDDELMNIKIVERVLLDESVEVVGVQSGEEALRVLEESEFDIVLLDLVMPGMDGFEVCKRISENHNIPIVFMTGERDLENIFKARELGVCDYITKPILPMILKETVHGVITSYVDNE